MTEVLQQILMKCPKCLNYKPINQFKIFKNQKRSKMCFKCQEYMREYIPKYNKTYIPKVKPELELTESEEMLMQIHNMKHTLFMLETVLKNKTDKISNSEEETKLGMNLIN